MRFKGLGEIREDKKAQVAPFFIVLIIILLIATMITVNIGKIGLTKTNTANASDAGALAGATMMANGLNSIQDISDTMFADYLAAQAVLASCQLSCPNAWNFLVVTGAANAAAFGYAWTVGREACKEGKETAKQLAFSNAGVDEAVKKDETYGGYVGLKEWMQRRNPQSSQEQQKYYEEWVKADSKFGEWMANEEYISGQYSWSDAQGGANSVKVDVDGPTGFELIPMPMPYVIICWVPCPTGTCCVFGGAGVFIFAAISAAINEGEHIQVTVTRSEPEIDLGLWRMRYAAQGEQGISSHGEAQAFEGSLLPTPFGGSDYDSKLVEPHW